ncbi:IS630 family transposase [Polymorphospora sp. NPDC050346]|uniref:IS630 family transposase n=1 Tax=Polymorphospora sp. NPDC050346 TaxID=3155780 RepID=UPI0033E08911
MSMPLSSPCPIVLSVDERAGLYALARRPTAAYRTVLRARIVLAAADGGSNAAIAAGLRLHVDTVRKWRGRFFTHRLQGLSDAPRAGRPRRFTDVQAAQVKALACELPAERGVPLSRWSAADLADEAVAAGVVDDISPATVARWLAADAIRPWRHRSWIFPRDPDFAARAAIVLDLYARTWQGRPLGEADFVISADEKTSIQARCHCHPSLPPGRTRLMRVEHEYQRGGALAYLAALDVHRGTVSGRCESSTGIAPFARLVEQVMTSEPYASADRVFWIVDNGSSHRGQASTDRITDKWPTTRLVHLPVHASWLNQIEIYFSIVQRKVVTPNDFHDLTDVEDRLAAFQDHYNLGARPFNWRYTKKDLDATFERLATYKPRTTAI